MEKGFLSYSKGQRIGLLLLVLVILFLQFFFFQKDWQSSPVVSQEEKDWMAVQKEIDSQKQILKVAKSPKMYPFNPNFISDFKGYKLGMQTDEIDRLQQFRASGRFVNSAEEFQEVTQISDSLLRVIAPFFKFPDWVKNKKSNWKHFSSSSYTPKEKKIKEIVVKDINVATKEDFMAIFGIGDAISERILKQRAIFGGFISMEQMEDVWGLTPEVIYELNKNFKVITAPTIVKIDINNASTKELMKLPYFRYTLAREIILYRSMNGRIQSAEDLTKIKGFPVEKVKIIALYLTF